MAPQGETSDAADWGAAVAAMGQQMGGGAFERGGGGVWSGADGRGERVARAGSAGGVDGGLDAVPAAGAAGERSAREGTGGESHLGACGARRAGGGERLGGSRRVPGADDRAGRRVDAGGAAGRAGRG